MVYDKSQTAGQKKPRMKVEGKLIGLQGDSTKAKVFDTLTGKFSWLGLSIVVGQNEDKTDIYKNITAYDIEMDKMPELKKADELIRNKKRPIVSLECYETEVPAKNKDDGTAMMEEVPEMRDGKEIVVQKQKVWKNLRMTSDDVINSFKILKDEAPEAPVEKEAEVVEEKVE